MDKIFLIGSSTVMKLMLFVNINLKGVFAKHCDSPEEANEGKTGVYIVPKMVIITHIV